MTSLDAGISTNRFNAPDTNMVAMGTNDPQRLDSWRRVEMPLPVARAALPGNVSAIMVGRMVCRPKYTGKALAWTAEKTGLSTVLKRIGLFTNVYFIKERMSDKLMISGTWGINYVKKGCSNQRGISNESVSCQYESNGEAL